MSEASNTAMNLEPKPPKWALDAGLPEPHTGEDFCAYVERLGIDCDELIVELTERTLPLANSRLAAKLTLECPEAWSRYKQARRRAVLPEHLL